MSEKSLRRMTAAVIGFGLFFWGWALGVWCGETNTAAEREEPVEIGEPMLRAEVRLPEELPEIALAKTVWGEARGCSVTEQAAVAWCVLNRVDSGIYPNDIVSVIRQQGQFTGYSYDNPVEEDILALVRDVLHRWEIECECVGHVGRVLPREYLWFAGDGEHNYFREEYKTSEYWGWATESPYEEER